MSTDLPDIGSKFGRLTVTAAGLRMPPGQWQLKTGRQGSPAVSVICDCGIEKIIRLNNLLTGRSQSCGCALKDTVHERWKDPEYAAEQRKRSSAQLKRLWQDPAFAERASRRISERNYNQWSEPRYIEAFKAAAAERKTIHGLGRHPLYFIHRSMMARCYQPAANGYQNWGGRGIQVWGTWHDIKSGVLALSDILGPRPPGMTVNRINNDGHYTPDNIEWATRREQARNRGHGNVKPLIGPECNRGASCPCRI